MNMINKSTGFSPFQLQMGRSPCVIPPLVEGVRENLGPEAEHAFALIKRLEQMSMEAQDNLLCTKISQAAHANKSRTLTFPFAIGGRVHLSTMNQRQEFKGSGEKRVAKFMPHYDRPYTIVDINEDSSMVTLDLPNSPNICPTFHTSKVEPHVENDAMLFPNREFDKPPAITMDDGTEEYLIHNIVDKRRCGRGYRYLVRWVGYGREEDRWLKGADVKDTKALDIWLAKQRMEMNFINTSSPSTSASR